VRSLKKQQKVEKNKMIKIEERKQQQKEKKKQKTIG